MDLDGLDALLANLDRMHDEIEDDVDKIVKNNTIEMTKETVKNERQRFDKGYATGYTMRNTKTEKVDKLNYRTNVASEHGGYLNYGTRYMDATWFLRDAYFKQRKKFLEDIERLVK
ncbi:HK97-gp10 family putative phage morphogenesis protein [Aquibacillus rhizosphaerae]|uniref:HK97 gp10 family phage protein n=1 Tax=Aquibacillus rhizosphaerae TaxID=3051431 RepID=A0ABT7LAD9_9BACI|nr:HK97-gp10 family putative phage morphogenesis protein [Aquibacillus sp. LR5S19]MDL4842835.1 hypothetical protein [Aquibacillus sp. LR5S19]